MNVSVEFPAEMERALEQQAASQGVDVPTFVRQLVTERLALHGICDTVKPAHTEAHTPAGPHFPERLRRWIQLHQTNTSPVDDSRESIYAGRDE